MDSNRFDALSRSFASRSSRRNALRWLGLGGLGAGALAAAGLNDSASAANNVICVLAITAPTAIGPDKGTSYNGELTLTIGPSGAIDEASLKLANGKTHKAVGQAVGRAINLRVDLGGGKTLALTGTGEQDLILCRGKVDGTFGGPDVADLGTWHAAKQTSAANGAATATSVSANGATGGPSSGSGNAGNGAGNSTGNGSGSGNSTGNGAAPTAAPTVAAGCPACQTLNNGACAPLADGTSCDAGSVCCKGQCVDTRQFEGDNANCGACGTVCPAGQFCSNGACGTCAQLGDRCAANGDCCSNFCNQGGCDQLTCPAGQALCQNQCFDTRQFDTDNANCGACGNACPAGQFCSNGACGGCAQLGDRCGVNGDCCSGFCDQGGCDKPACAAGQTACGPNCVDTSSDAGNCGACGKSCPLGAVCTASACVAPAACLPDGAVCAVDADCCGGFCIVGVLGNPDTCSH